MNAITLNIQWINWNCLSGKVVLQICVSSFGKILTLDNVTGRDKNGWWVGQWKLTTLITVFVIYCVTIYGHQPFCEASPVAAPSWR